VFDNIVISHPSPTFADLDGDDDFDLIVGEHDGSIHFYENTGSVTSPTFTARTGAANPFDGINVGYNAAPAFADLDADDDFDLILGRYSTGPPRYYENTGSRTAPVFTELFDTANPFNKLSLSDSSPAFADLDGDGLQDLVIGQNNGKIDYHTNAGSQTCLKWKIPTTYTDGECLLSCAGKVCTCVKFIITPACPVNEVQTASGCSKITTDIKAAFVAQGHCVG
jgi:hypothetical protein